MRRYETIVIIDPDLPKEELEPLYDRVRNLIDQQGGLLIELEEWGVQKLAYEIKKKNRGHYIRLEYCGLGPLISEMERFYRIDDRVLKYLTVLLDETPDVEALRQQQQQTGEETPEKSDASHQEDEKPAEADTTPEPEEEDQAAAEESATPSDKSGEDNEAKEDA